MTATKRWGVALAAALALTGAGLVGAASHAAADVSIATAITDDPNASNGSITFYNASGSVVTSGTDLTAVFKYAAASSAGRNGATKATVYFAFPDHTQTDSQNWFSSQTTPSTNFPNASAPAPVNGITKPVATAGSGDANLAELLSTTTLDHTTGYDGIVQVRLFDSGPGVPIQTTPFWATDILFNQAADTWQQVFPSPATATTTTLGAAPAGHAAPGATVTLTATVSPAAAGTVQFMDGPNPIGSAVAVTSGSAQTTTSALTTGTHGLSAVFTPTDPGSYNGSSSAAVSYVVADAPGVPTNVTATAGNASAAVSWTAPALDGGAPVVGYDIQYSSDNGTTWTSANPAFHLSTATTHQVAGLTNGSAYVFRVAAINGAAQGAYSTQTSAVTPVADASALTISHSVTIKYGASTKTGTLLKNLRTGLGIANAPVQLFSRTTGGWVLVGTVKTASNGAASKTVKPTGRTAYQWRYAGSATVRSSTSATQTVSVTQVVSAAVTPAKVRHGKSVKVYGTVGPTSAGQKVTLQVLSGRIWKTVASVVIKKQKLPNGKTATGYVFSVKLAKKGSYSYRVYKAATKSLLAGYSGTVHARAT